MDGDDYRERRKRDVMRMLQFITEEGGAGGLSGPDGLHLGLPNWEERTKDQRPSERIRSHGYPFGFAKSQWHLRQRLLERFRRRVQSSSREGRHELREVHEAVARALDWERMLGSFNHPAAGDGDRFPLDTIDPVADHLGAWLDHQGYRVVPKDPPTGDDPLPTVEPRFPMIFDLQRHMIVPVGEPDGYAAEAALWEPGPDQAEDDGGAARRR